MAKGERESVYTDLIKSYMESSSKGQLKLVVVGEAGQGKSTLINGLLGKEVATEGEEFDAGTLVIKRYELNQNGIHVKIWDTPGFGIEGDEEDEKMVEQLRSSDCYPIDLALFCFRMDGTRFPTQIHKKTIKKLTEVFGNEFWKYTVFVLTFANNVENLCKPNEDFEYFFSNRVIALEEKIQATLKKEIKLPQDIIDRVRAIPVGSYKIAAYDKNNPWKLPDREDWFIWFWIECTDHIRQSSLIALLKANGHRIKVVNEEAPPFGQDPPVPLQKESYERSVQTPLAKYIVGDKSNEEIPPPHQMGLEGPGEAPLQQYEIEVNLEPEFTQNIEESTTAPLSLNSQITEQTDIISTEDSENLPPTEASENLTAPPFSREIPLVEILLRQLDNEDSSFSKYLTEFAKKRGSSVWGIGHVGGLMEGFIRWLGKGRRIRNKQQQPPPV